LDTTTPIASVAEQPKYYRLLAPWWHTLIVVGILLFLSLSQAHRLSAAVQHRGRLSLYITTMIVQWTMVVIIWLGNHWRGLRLRDLVGGKWKSPEDVLLDVGIAAGFWIVALGVLAGVRLALGQLSFNSAKNMEQAKEMVRTLDFLTPHGLRELIFFTAVAITAGFCEELIFRGYLQKQFHAASGNALVGIVAQALLFGASHGYQGVKSMLVIGVFGALFGALAFWRRSLRPGMITHAWQDFLAGLLLGAYAGTR